MDYNDIIEELCEELEAAHKVTDGYFPIKQKLENEKLAKKLLADGEITDQDLEIFLEYDKQCNNYYSKNEYASGPNFRKNTKKGDTK